MINSSYAILYRFNKENHMFLIDRTSLYECLQETKMICYYDNTQHQGVKINFMYNKDKDGICRCEKTCLSQSKLKRNCKKITILIFNSGKLIITGANEFVSIKVSI